jgi:nuclear pore complex protein Nup62
LLLCRQLEENINKWTLDLEDMEKVFLNQATQVRDYCNVSLSPGSAPYIL